MISKRRIFAIPQGDGSTLHKVVITSIDCNKDTDKSRYIQMELFKQLSLVPDLSCCTTLPFEKLIMNHNGMNWEVTLTAIEKAPET